VDDALATAVAVLADRDATADIIREATASLRRALDQLVVADRAATLAATGPEGLGAMLVLMGLMVGFGGVLVTRKRPTTAGIARA